MNNSGHEVGRTLLYVHGRDFKPNADDYLEICIASIAAGIERDFPDSVGQFNSLSKRLAYYGDITDEFLTNQGLRYDETLDVGDRRNALTSLKSISKKKNFGVNRYDQLPGKSAVPEFAVDIVAPILGRLGFSKKLLKKVGVDLAEYWQEDKKFAGQIRGRVRDALRLALDAREKIVLISHGTGCVVAYDVLWELSHDPEFVEIYANKKIDLWLTLGAPLGDAMVQKRILGATESGVRCYPTNVVSWHNISAEDDFVSHDNTLADDFNKMMTQHQVSCIRDYRIYNMSVRYGRSNPHSSIGYLIHPRTAQILTEWLQQN